MAGQAKEVGMFVQRKISWLAKNGTPSATKAILANLRRGIGSPPGSHPELWEFTLGGLPECLLSKGDEASQGEWAIHTALGLYALHQQGMDVVSKGMHNHKVSLGLAVRRLVSPTLENEEAVRRRFHTVAVADSYERLTWHLRGLIQMLRAADIPLDYTELAADLYWFQVPERRDSIRLKWGQEFYRIRTSEEANGKSQKGEQENEIEESI